MTTTDPQVPLEGDEYNEAFSDWLNRQSSPPDCEVRGPQLWVGAFLGTQGEHRLRGAPPTSLTAPDIVIAATNGRPVRVEGDGWQQVSEIRVENGAVQLDCKGIPRQVRIYGSGIVELAPKMVLTEPDFRAGDGRGLNLAMHSGSRVAGATGRVRLQIDGNGISFVGDQTLGTELIVVVAPNSTGQIETAQLEQVNIFSGAASVAALVSAKRLTPWWPRNTNGTIDRRHAIRLANHLDEDGGDESPGGRSRGFRVGWKKVSGTREDRVNRRDRAEYWSRIAERLHRSGGGQNFVVAQELAYDTSRRAKEWRNPERWFLEVFRIFGYATRVRRPLAIWMGLAAVLAYSLGGRATFFSLWLELLSAPVSFARSADTSSEISRILVDGTFSDALAVFGARIIGSASLLASGIAVRRYVKLF